MYHSASITVHGHGTSRCTALYDRLALDKQEEIRTLHEKEKDLQQKIKGLEREIAAHKREIKYRDDTIGEKEKKIYELKKKNQEVRLRTNTEASMEFKPIVDSHNLVLTVC